MNEERPSTVSDKTYLGIWLGLVLLTGVTVSVAGMNLGGWSIYAVLILAGIKSRMVLNYFMHLKFERRFRLLRWMIPGTLFLLILFIGFTFLDVVFR